MKFTSKMNGWGRAGVLLNYVVAAFLVLTAIAGLAGPTEVGQAIALVIAIIVASKVEEDKVTNGTLFCTALSPVLGLIAHLINGKPKAE